MIHRAYRALDRLGEQAYRTIVLVVADACVLTLCAILAFLLRFEGSIPALYRSSVIMLFAFNIVTVIPLFFWQRIYTLSLSFVSIRDIYRIVKVIAFSTILSFVGATLARDYHVIDQFPRSAILINALSAITLLCFIRMSKRLVRELRISHSGKRILIIGADAAGAQLAKSLLDSRLYTVIGFLDDRAGKRNTTIHQIPVLGISADIARIVTAKKIDEIIITEPADVRKVIEQAREHGVDIARLKVLPTVSDVIGGKITLARVRDISIEDLLGRKSVSIDTARIRSFLQGKRVMVTGAAGSIGSRLVLQILAFHPQLLIAVDQNETGIFNLERSMRSSAPMVPIRTCVLDVCDSARMNAVCKDAQPDIIFHAAAYKHVSVMEANPLEAIKNNIFGMLSVARAATAANVSKFVFISTDDAAEFADVRRFVLISTDKAVRPVSVMGMTKRVGEMICVALHKRGPTKFCAVRFGNVLDSQGNVIELFREAIKRGGPLEITHPDMQRYFMVTSEACLLVMQAGALSEHGEIFCLDMGKPVMITDLAKELIRLAGYEPNVDIPIVYTQPRPGERLFEELLTEGETPTQYEKIFTARLHGNSEHERLIDDLSVLKQGLDRHDEEGCRALLSTLATSKEAI